MAVPSSCVCRCFVALVLAFLLEVPADVKPRLLDLDETFLNGAISHTRHLGSASSQARGARSPSPRSSRSSESLSRSLRGNASALDHRERPNMLGRRLQSCGTKYQNSEHSWKLSCGGPLGTCGPPVCLAGYSMDTGQSTCTVESWQAPICIPWTVRVEALGVASWAVDTVYNLVIRAFGPSNAISLVENRPVIVTLQGSTGSTSQHTVTISSGEGSLVINHTVAENVIVALAGANYSSTVQFRNLTISFTNGVPTQYVFVDKSLTGTVDALVNVRVEARDRYGNACKDHSTGIRIEWKSLLIVQGFQTVHSVLVSSLVNGMGSGNMWETQPGIYNLTLTDAFGTQIDHSDTMTVTFIPGATTRFAIAQPTPNVYTVGSFIVIAVNCWDQYNNFVDTEQRDVKMIASSGIIPHNGNVNIVNGVGWTSFTHTVAEFVTLSLHDSQGTGADVSSTAQVIFTPGPGFRTTIAASTSQNTVDSTLPVEVTVWDQYNNVATGETRQVSVTVTGISVTGAGLVSFSLGKATRSIGSQKPQNVTVGLSDTTGTGMDVSSSVSLLFSPGAAAKVVLSAPASGVVGAQIAVTLTATDQYNNVVTTSASSSFTVNSMIRGGHSIAVNNVVTLQNGVATVSIAGTKVGQLDLTVSDTSSTGLDVSTTATIALSAGPAVEYVLQHRNSVTQATVDNALEVNVLARDQFANLATTEQRNVGVKTSASATSTTTVSISNGAGIAQITHTTPATLTLVLSDIASTGLDVTSTLAVTFLPGASKKVVFSAATSTGTVDAAITVTLRAEDQYGNLATSESRSVEVHMTFTGGQVVQTNFGSVSFTGGQASVPVSRTTPGNVQVTCIDANNIGVDCSSSVILSFTVGAPSAVTFTTPQSVVVGSSSQVSLNAVDQHGNVVAAASSRLTMSVTGSATISNSGVVQFVNGFAALTISNIVAESVTLSMADSFNSGLSMTSTKQVAFLAGPATKYIFISPPSQASVDNGVTLQVQAQDQYNNLAAAHSADVTVRGNYTDTSGAQQYLNAQLVDISSGAGQVSISHTLPGLVTFSLQDSQATGLDVTSTCQVSFTTGISKSVALQANNVSGTVDAAIMVTLTAKDKYGNVVTSESRSMGIGTSGQQVTAITAPTSVNFNHGIAAAAISSTLMQAVQVSLTDIAGTNMDVSATLQLQFAYGALHHFSMRTVSGATSVLRTVNKLTDFATQAQDQFNNIVMDGKSIVVQAAFEPTPTNGSATTQTIGLTNGMGSSQFVITVPGLFKLRVNDAWEGTVGGQASATALATAAVPNSAVFNADYRLDLTPPAIQTLSASDVATQSLKIDLSGISELSQIWCIAANLSTAAAVTPTSTADGAVYAALRGSTGQSTSSPHVSSIQFYVSSAQLTLTGLEANRTYVLRCALADESRNHMLSAEISQHQLTVKTLPHAPVQPPQPSSDDKGVSTAVVVAIILISVSLAICCCCFAIAVKVLADKREKGMMETLSSLKSDFAKVIPEPTEETAKAQQPVAAPEIQEEEVPVEAESKEAAAAPKKEILFIDTSTEVPSENSSEEEVLDLDGSNDTELLRQALQMEQELLEELEKREEDDWYDSASEDSETEAVLRDVKAFLKKSTSNLDCEEESIALPDLPLKLNSDDEARIDALVALGQQNIWWSDRLSKFETLWQDSDGLWQEVRITALAEQERLNKYLEAKGGELKDAEAQLVSLAEVQALSLLDDLAGQDEAFMKLTNEVLQKLHTVTVDWPEEDSRLREAVIEEWTPLIREAAKKPGKQTVRKDAVAALERLEDERELALEKIMDGMETEAALRYQSLSDEYMGKWRKICDRLDAEALELRTKVSDLKLQQARLACQAEEAALNSAVQLRYRLRDATVETEYEKECAEREREVTHYQATIRELLRGDEDEKTSLRNRALNTLERVAKNARKVAMEENERRKGHWQEILQERGRERLRAARRRCQEEERRLQDAFAKAEEDALDAESLRRAGLTLGAAHRAEAALLNVTAAGRRGRILLGLQATAAGSVAEERLPKKERPQVPTPETAQVPPMEAKPSSADELEVPKTVDSCMSLGMAATGTRWQAAHRRAAEELSDAIGVVATALAEHGYSQRWHLSHRQNREAYLARQPEGDDNNIEDLLDALEESMHREIRVERWREVATDAEALAHCSAGEETELGRRLAAVARDSELLETEDRIGEKYDRLRAFVLKGHKGSDLRGSLREIESAQHRAAQLEEEAARLRRELRHDVDSDDESGAGGDDEDFDAALQKMGARRSLRQKKRDEIARKVNELMENGQVKEALELLHAALQADAQKSDVDDEERAKLQAKFAANLQNVDSAQDDDLEAQRLELQRKRRQRQKRRRDVQQDAQLFEDQGKSSEAVDAMLQTLLDEGSTSDDDKSALDEIERLKIKLAKDYERMEAGVADDEEAQRLNLEVRRAQRQKKRKKMKDRAEALQTEGNAQEAVEILTAMLNADVDGSNMDWDEARRLIASRSAADRDKLKDEFAADMDILNEVLNEDFEAQRLKLQTRQRERQERREKARRQAQELAAKGKLAEAAALLKSVMPEEGSNSEKDWNSTVGPFGSLSDEEREKIKSQVANRLEKAEDVLADDAEAQLSKINARRAERQRRRAEVLRQAESLRQQGKDAEAAELLNSLLTDDISSSDADWNAERELDPSVTAAERARIRDLLAANLETVNAIAGDSSESQLIRLEARRAARQKRREESRRKAQKLMDEGRVSEAMELLKAAATNDGADSDADWEENRKRRGLIDASVSDAERERLRVKMAAGMDHASSVLGEDDEAQRLKLEARRAARQKRREEVQRQAQELHAKGKDDEAVAVIAAAMREEVSESDGAWRSEIGASTDEEMAKLREKMGLGIALADDEAEAQRLKMEARRAERQKRRQNAQRQAQELAGKGDAATAMEVMAAAMEEEGETSDADFAERRKARSPLDASVLAADRAKLQDKFAAGAQHAQDVLNDDSEAQRMKNEERKRQRQKRREEAEERVAMLEEAAAELRAQAELPGEVSNPNEEVDLLAAWQEELRQRATSGALAEVCHNGMDSAARRLLDTAVPDDDRSALKEAFAAEMDRCQEVVADEREAQKQRAQDRLEARRLRREEAKKKEQASKVKSAAKKHWAHAHHLIGGVTQIKKDHHRIRTKKLLEHAEIEKRVRAECDAEYRALEERLVRKADEEIARLKEKLKKRDQAGVTKVVSQHERAKVREEGLAKAEEAEDMIDVEKQKQAAKIEKRLADRKKRLQKREALTRQGHAQEEVRLEIQHEQEKLHAKPLSKMKAKSLVKDLYKVKNLIGKLQDPSGSILPGGSTAASSAMTIEAVTERMARRTPRGTRHSTRPGSRGSLLSGLQPPAPPQTAPGMVRDLSSELFLSPAPKTPKTPLGLHPMSPLSRPTSGAIGAPYLDDRVEEESV